MKKVVFYLGLIGVFVLLGCSGGGGEETATIRPTRPTRTPLPTKTFAPTWTPTMTWTPAPTLAPVYIEFDYRIPQEILRNPEVDSRAVAEIHPGDQLLLLGYISEPYKAFYVETDEGIKGWLFWKLGMIPATDNDFIAVVPTVVLSPTPTPRPRATSRPIEGIVVVYEVTGSAHSVNLTYENETGGTEQRQDVPLPYRKTFGVESGAFVYISAQNTGDSGTVQCKITVDGQVLETASSSGAYVIASCGGLVD